MGADTDRYRGKYTYKGDLTNGTRDMYRNVARAMPTLPTKNGALLSATDARRGLHNTKLMPPNFRRFRRLHLRAFITGRPDLKP